MANNSNTLTGLNSITLKEGDSLPSLATDAFRLYNMRFCPYAERAVLYAAKKNIPIETINVNLQKKPSWFVERNPLGKVPVIERNGNIVYESMVVCEYLDEIFPETSILPRDPYQKAHQKILVERLGSLVPAMYAMVRAKDDETRKTANTQVHSALANAEMLLTDDFYGGITSGFADLMLWPFFERLELLKLDANSGFKDDFPPKEKYPKLSAYFSRMKMQPEIKIGIRPLDQHAAFIQSYLAGEPDYDIGIEAAKL